MSTPIIDQFLTEIGIILREKNGKKLQEFLLIEPPLPQLYTVIVTELRQTFLFDRQAQLETKCSKTLPEDQEGSEGGSWTAFLSFLVQYFVFLRDVNVEQLVETHDMLKALLKSVKAATTS